MKILVFVLFLFISILGQKQTVWALSKDNNSVREEKTLYSNGNVKRTGFYKNEKTTGSRCRRRS